LLWFGEVLQGPVTVVAASNVPVPVHWVGVHQQPQVKPELSGILVRLQKTEREGADPSEKTDDS